MRPARLLVWVMLLAGPALATPNFPSALKRELGLTYTVDCSLCHLNGVTGRGTVTTPFGMSMRGAGLNPGDEASLKAALASLKADGIDSDRDGVGDVPELVAATNPYGVGRLDTPRFLDPEYGCGADTTGAVLGVAWLSLSLLGRRKK